MSSSQPIFLRAEWHHLLMMNYTVDPAVLRPFVPRGTELDFFHGETFLSIVGFQFVRTRVLGVAIPMHTEFEEVNLRFYVRRRVEGTWLRGVVFISELVPRPAIAWVARTLYGEPYRALPMRHRVGRSLDGIRVHYAWRRSGLWESLSAEGHGKPQEIAADSEEEFITEHYLGYNAHRGGCTEYEVEHPRWRIWSDCQAEVMADFSCLYGEQFVKPLTAKPSSVFIADGSAVAVRKGVRVA